MSLSKANRQPVSSKWPDELLEAVLRARVDAFFDCMYANGRQDGPVMGTECWKGAQAAFRLWHCCKRMKVLLGPDYDTLWEERLPGRLEDMAQTCAGTFAWTKVGEIAHSLDQAMRAADRIVDIDVAPEAVCKYVFYRVNDIGQSLKQKAAIAELPLDFIAQTEDDLDIAGYLRGDSETLNGDPADHILALQTSLEERRLDQQLLLEQELAQPAQPAHSA